MTEPTHDHLTWEEPARTWLLGRLWALWALGAEEDAHDLLRDSLAASWLMGAEACVDALNRQAELVPPAYVMESQRPAGDAGRPDIFGVFTQE